MAALTADAPMPHKGHLTKIGVKCVGADTFYEGALVYGDATDGKAQATATTTEDDVFLGICARNITTTAANQIVEVYVDGLWAFRPTVAIVEGDVGDVLIIDDSATLSDNPADCVTGAAATTAVHDILIGKIIAIDITETDRAWVKIKPGYNYVAASGWE